MNGTDRSKPKVIVLDVYETLLNMGDVERRINSIMDSKRGYNLWMELFMQYCFVSNCTGQFHDFMSIARATMMMCGKTLGKNLSDISIAETLDLLSQLPLQEGVQEGLSDLNDHGFTIIALTNAPCQTVRERMEPSGLISYFEKVFSAEQVKKYKPCADVYQWAAGKLEVPIEDMLLVSAHGWDLAGGTNAGMQTAYLKQQRQMLYPLAPTPDYVCSDLVDLAKQLI